MDLTKFGFKAPEPKERKSEAEKLEQKREYEKKRARNFQESWLKEFDGLKYELDELEGTMVMYCKICRDHTFSDKTCSMNIGTSAFRRDTLLAHWKSSTHVRCAERVALEKKATSTFSNVEFVGPIVDCARKMDDNLEKQIQKLINTTFFVCKEEMAFTTYTSLITLQTKNGLDLGNFYKSDNACRRFVRYIYEELYQQSLQVLSEKKFFSILIDGATDSSVTENELIYVRFVDDGIPVNHYLSVEDIQNANAPGILDTIETAFERANMNNWKEKVVGFGSDGASVNLGSRAGVGALLKNYVNHLIIIHCVAHRLELAATNAIKHHKIMRDTQDLLHHIYKQYHYYPKALRELKDIAEALEEKVLKPTNLHRTRWLPHIHKALEVLTSNFTVILTHFDHIMAARAASAEVQGRATNVSRKLKEYTFLYMVFFMLDVLDVLSQLSLKFQTDEITLSHLLDAITTAHQSLVELKTTNGENLDKFISNVNVDVQNGTGTYGTIQLNNVQVGEEFTQRREQIIGSIMDALQNRFSAMEQDPVLKSAVVLLDFADYPNDRNNLADFGNDELNILMQHFHAILQNARCNIQAVGGEWKNFKSRVFNHRKVPIENYFKLPDLQNRFQNCLMLIEILLALPLSSAACERGFSAMKRIKSDWRSTLKPSMLRMLMFISIEGPSVEEFDSIPVINRWWTSGRAKKPGFNPFDFRVALGGGSDSEESDN